MTTANNPVVTAELLPCPFCGERAFRYAMDGGFVAECEGCACRTSICDSKGVEIETWNTRAMTQASPPPDEMVQSLLEAVDGMLSCADHVDERLRYTVGQAIRAALHSIGPMRGWDEVVSFIVKIPAQRGWIRWQKRSGLIRQLDDARAVAEEAAKHHGHARIVERRSLISETQIETLSALKRIEGQG